MIVVQLAASREGGRPRAEDRIPSFAFFALSRDILPDISNCAVPVKLYCDAGTLLRQCCLMRILALDHGTKRIGVAVSDEMKMISSPLEYIPAEPFAEFLARLKAIIREKEVELIVLGMPRNMDGSYGPAALKVQEFAAVLKDAITVPIKTLDERLTTVQAQRFLIQGGVRRDKRKEKVDKTAAAILLQSYLDSLAP